MRSFINGVKNYPNKKPYLEFFTALLTIPVLLSIVAVNYNNLTGNKKTEPPKQTSTVVITKPQEKESNQKEIITKKTCLKGLGPISILSPEEGDNLSENPVQIDIFYDDSKYCQAVWSYRINGGNWSSYDDRSIVLYDLPIGNVKFDLRVKSVVNNDKKNLTRNFVYLGRATEEKNITPSITPSN